MIIYIADRKMNILGVASTELKSGYLICDDSTLDEVDSGLTSFDCVISFEHSQQKNASELFAAGNYVLRQAVNKRTDFLTIIDQRMDNKDREIEIHCENAGVDLLNEIVPAYTADQARPIAWYIAKWAYDTGFEIGVNEIPNLTRKLKWEGESTCAERIASTATQFDNAEIDYEFEIDGFTVIHKYINIRQKRGKDENAQLRVNREIDKIVVATSIANLCTGLAVTGGTPEGKDKPITLAGYKYDDGDFYVSSDGRLYSRSALAVWSRYVNENEPNQIAGQTGHIIRYYSYETTSQQTLCAHALTELKKLCVPEQNYEITLSFWDPSIEVGDTVNVVDENGELYLQTRVLSLEYSETRREYKVTFGEFLIKTSGISDQIRALAASFSELANSRPFYTWIAYADDAEGTNISIDPGDRPYMGIARNRITADPDISDPTVYTWSKVRGNDGNDGLNVAQLFLYKRSTTTPTAPSGSLLYNFSTKTLSGELEGWTKSLPSGTDPVYMIVATATSTTDDDSIGQDEWSTPAVFSQDGIAGYNQATIFLYQRSPMNEPPSQPVIETTYRFESGVLTPLPVGWSREIPDSNGYPCWVTTAVAISQNGSYVIQPSAWSTATKIATNGDNGEDAVLLRVDSSRGNVFKNNAVSTVLTVNIIKAGDIITTATRMREVFGNSAYIQWYWKRLDDTDFHVIVNTDPMISQEGFALTLSPDNVDTKVTFQCELIT